MNGARACPQAQLSATSVPQPRVPPPVFAQEHGSFLGPPARALRWAWTTAAQAGPQWAKVAGLQMQKPRRALVPPSVPQTAALYTWDGEATRQALLCCGPGPKCTGGLAFVKEQDKSVPQCRGNKVSRLTLGREPVGNRSRALREGPLLLPTPP